jgi:hypothetical protein
MATKKVKTPTDEKLEKQDFDLFDALNALDKKDYGYYSRLTPEQQKKFVPFMLIHWMSAVKGTGGIPEYYVRSVDHYANKYFLNETISQHPELQWLMLCSASPGLGKQFHQWIPHLSTKIGSLKEVPKEKEIREYFSKIYPKASEANLYSAAEGFVVEQKTKVYLAENFPAMKQTDIETLSKFVTQEDLDRHDKDLGK